jgi:pimeloyl-ACP methyl ester carboxylesterase
MQQQLALQVAKVSLDFQALSQEPASLADYADAVKSPVLLLSGSHSRQSAQRISAALRSVLPDVRLQRLECGHMGPVTHPDLVNKPIADFLLV